MALSDVLAALVSGWDDIVGYLEPADLRVIGDAIRPLESGPQEPASAQAAMAELTALLVVRLPAGHAMREVLAREGRLAGSAMPPAELASALRALPGLGSVLAGPPLPGAAGQEAQDRLLAAPALTPEQVRERGIDPDHSDLITLTPANGPARVPVFQFGPDGALIPVVAAINRLLQSAEDPWGVADWWLGGNAWLRAVPADLIGHVADDLLTQAAAAELADG